MSGKPDWETAHREWVAEAREREGPPPTAEQVEALFQGRLDEAEAERVRALLVLYPQMARAMTEPFPDDAAEALDATELAEHRAALRTRLGLEKTVETSARRFPFRPAAIAAGIVIVLALGAVPFLFRDRTDLRPVTTKILFADGERGGSLRGVPTQAPIELAASTRYRLKPVFRPPRAYPTYRLDLLDVNADPPRTLWKRDGLQRQSDGSYPIEMATDELRPGRYELVLYGVDNQSVTRLATYTLRIYAQ